MRFWRVAVAVVLIGAAITPSLAQHASISLRAVVPSTAQLSQDDLPIVVTSGQAGDGAQVSVPVDLKWNVDRFVREIQIIARFKNGNRALLDNSGRTISASALQVRIEGSNWETFPSTSGAGSSALLLQTIYMTTAGRQGRQTITVEVRLPPDVLLSSGEYAGHLALQAVMF